MMGRLHLKVLLMPNGTNEKSPEDHPPKTRRRAQVHCGSWRLTGASVPCTFKDYAQSNKACFSALCWIDFFWELGNVMFMHSLAGFLAPHGIENQAPSNLLLLEPHLPFQLPVIASALLLVFVFASLLTEFSGWWVFTGQQQAAN